jgi:hypothetical protein
MINTCSKTNCKAYFHVTCAQASGLLCEEQRTREVVTYCGYCFQHYHKVSKKENVKAIPAFRDPEFPDSTPESSPEKPRDVTSTRSVTVLAIAAGKPVLRHFEDQQRKKSSKGENSESRADTPPAIATSTADSGCEVSGKASDTRDPTDQDPGGSNKFTTANFTETVVTPAPSAVLLNIGRSSGQSSPSSPTDQTQDDQPYGVSANKRKSREGDVSPPKRTKKRRKRVSARSGTFPRHFRDSEDEDHEASQQELLLSKLKPTSVVLNQLSSSHSAAVLPKVTTSDPLTTISSTSGSQFQSPNTISDLPRLAPSPTATCTNFLAPATSSHVVVSKPASSISVVAVEGSLSVATSVSSCSTISFSDPCATSNPSNTASDAISIVASSANTQPAPPVSPLQETEPPKDLATSPKELPETPTVKPDTIVDEIPAQIPMIKRKKKKKKIAPTGASVSDRESLGRGDERGSWGLHYGSKCVHFVIGKIKLKPEFRVIFSLRPPS